MSLECPAGFSPTQLPTTPPATQTLLPPNKYQRISYEWELADNLAPPSCACGQTATFNFAYGVSSDGTISVTPFGVGGGVGGSDITATELSVNVGGDGYEYIGYKVVLKKITESGTYTTSGGFTSGGFFAKIGFFFSYLRNGLAAVVPTMTFNRGTITEEFIQAAWKLCRKPCKLKENEN